MFSGKIDVLSRFVMEFVGAARWVARFKKGDSVNRPYHLYPSPGAGRLPLPAKIAGRGWGMGARQAAPLLLVMFLASPAMSATINVTANATDTLATNSSCSLREAITNINNATTTYADCAPTGAYGTSDTINIPAGTYTTTIDITAAGTEDDNANGDYDINESVSIVGAGASTTTINGGGLDRVFDIPVGLITVSISGVTITGGDASDGGGINTGGALTTITNSTISGNTATSYGGGIFIGGALTTITNSTISGNSVQGSGGGIANNGGTLLTITKSTISGNWTTSSYSAGGGIYNGAPLKITNSTISGNTMTDGCTSLCGGGGIQNDDTLTITNSTITSNVVDGDGGGIYNGSDSYATSNSTAIVTNSTISGNSARDSIYAGESPGEGGGIYNHPGSTVTLSNSIVANNTVTTQEAHVDCLGTITSSGYNLESSTSCGFAGTGDLQNTNPLLSALADNGGPTQTMALQSGSPAIDAGSCVKTKDQRGTARPQGATCDIGAYEYDGGTVTGTAPTPTTGSITNKTQTGVTFNGTVNPNGLSTTVKFQYGTTTSYGSKTADQTFTGSTDQAVTEDVADLTCGTTYYYRVWASNSGGTAKGSAVTFTTAGCNAPVVTTDAATNKTTTGATLNATVNPKKASTTVRFQYGLTSSYGSRTAAQTLTGNTAQAVTDTLTGLTCGTKYYFRVRASNSSGVTRGSGLTFKTSACADAP